MKRKEFVQGAAALGVAMAAGISFGKERKTMKKTELKTLASDSREVVRLPARRLAS